MVAWNYRMRVDVQGSVHAVMWVLICPPLRHYPSLKSTGPCGCGTICDIASVCHQSDSRKITFAATIFQSNVLQNVRNINSSKIIMQQHSSTLIDWLVVDFSLSLLPVLQHDIVDSMHHFGINSRHLCLLFPLIPTTWPMPLSRGCSAWGVLPKRDGLSI
jgi:hypothetical protein